MIVAHTVITIEPHHRSLFLCQRRNQYLIEVFDITLRMGKLIVAHTVITLEPHHDCMFKEYDFTYYTMPAIRYSP